MEITLYQKISIVTSLYFLQGAILGFLMGSTPLLFSTILSISKLATLQIISLPFSIKLFIAPLVDLNPFTRFGKRRSVIVVCILCIIPLFYMLSSTYSSLSGEKDLANIDLNMIITISFLIVLFTAIKDIALDSLCLNLFSSNSESHYGALCQTVGQTSGDLLITLAYSFYSDTFNCLHTFGNFLKFVPLLSVVLLVVVIFSSTIKRAEKNEKNNKISLYTYFRKILRLLKNKNLAEFFFIVISSRLGLAFFEECYTLEIIKLGYSKGLINKISIVAIVLNIAVTIYYEKKMNGGGLVLWLDFLKKKSYISILAFSSLMLLKYPSYYSYFTFLPPKSSLMFQLLLFGVLILMSTISGIMFTVMFSFMNTVCDEEIGGTYITIFASTINFSRLSGNFIQMKLLGYLNENIFVSGILSIIYTSVWILLFENKVVKISMLKNHQWNA
eukprot:GAHX01001667.1.p1 GENE.GAHX01001667.1~~GAHX01001667.1.p1  ORF type:complete len:444 (+),score=49.54 GAHX01001667.1:52-1383(+)